MVASNIVPLDAIVVEVVQNGQARLALLQDTGNNSNRYLERVVQSNIREVGTYIIFAVVGLWATITTSAGPVTKSALVGGGDLGFGARPEPSIDDSWLKISAVASIEVAFATASPDVLDAI